MLPKFVASLSIVIYYCNVFIVQPLMFSLMSSVLLCRVGLMLGVTLFVAMWNVAFFIVVVFVIMLGVIYAVRRIF